MSEYLLTAKHADGRVVTEWMAAASGDEAVELLRQRGCTEIVFHIEDLYAGPNNPRGISHRVSPQQYLASRQGRSYLARGWSLVCRCCRRLWRLNLGLLAILVVYRICGATWNQSGDGLLYLLIVLLVVGYLGDGTQRYLEMVEAASWGRWEEVLQRLATLRWQIPAHEVAVRKAQALAGLGRLEEGLRVLEPFATSRRVPEWLYWARLMPVYNAAQQWDMSLTVMEKAFELAPDNPTALLDMAYMLLRERRDVVRARHLLDQARRHVLNEVTGAGLAKAEGMLALEEGRASVAIDWLEKAKRELLPLYAANPLVRANFDQIDAYLALAYAACGDAQAATDHFLQAEPRLRALGCEPLLRRCEQVVQIPSPPRTSPIDTGNPYQSPGAG